MDCDFVENKLKELGLVLPPAPQPVGAYVPMVVSGSWGFLSGQISKDAAGKVMTGCVGRDLNVEEGRKGAELAALNALSILKAHAGFGRVARCVRLVGYVQTERGFEAIPEVVNGASRIFLEVFGERGRHARSAVGMAALPLNAAVEIELTVELADG